MKIFFKLSVLLLYTAFSLQVFAQNNNLNGSIVQRSLQIIDDSHMENRTLSASQNGFREIIYNLATSTYKGKSIQVYIDTNLTNTKSAAEILKLGFSIDSIEYAPDPNYPDYFVDTILVNPFSFTSISRYLILFDSIVLNNGKPAYQPIAIAPLYSSSVYGVEIKESVLFWAKWTDLEPILQSIPYYSAYNRNAQRSYSDYFESRLFISSAIIKKIIIE